ncbi:MULTISPECIES: TetR/AcrR family transcriptional regulator [Thermoactinomyces]|nr:MULTISPECIES: TetR/AcrR family transcriptional regulator [Thermoactinomyces]KFZ40328.1 TetR family transcriptional regulator [Thermoactinomyces sp. Gus2-1]KYQ86156.1 TetR family transcriptional regulator [Thermoactinomyces sp. AS95]MCF6135641.1 TetR/AcrR family transcriptional regulator [Thermoactinomyces vulgaris]QBK13043.1 TetR/AcrR family transcriptional regulator [Thermoactinomyces vulgaris]QCV54416.1 TetR/AcrR family transcriptional regulator [Thermoactinomyces vulgaris]
MKKHSKLIPSMIKNERLIEQRREQIIEGAVRLFVEKGFHKTTTREIARECGLSIGTMYEYIQSKEDVLYLVCEHIHSKLESRLLKVMNEEDTGMESLQKSLKQLFRVMDEMRSLVLLIYQETKSLPKDKMKYVLKKEEEITNLFSRILEKGMNDGTIRIDPSSIKLMAHNIMVIGQMWTFRHWALGREYDVEEYTKRQMALLLGEFTAGGDRDAGD